MTEDELKQFTELAKKYERGKDKDAVLKVISESAHEVFQEINDRGHSAATKAKQGELDALSGQVTDLKTRAETAEGKLKAFDDKAPDVAKVRETYEAAEKTLRKQYDDAATKKDQEYQQELKKRDEALVKVRLDVAKKQLVERLTADTNKVDRDYAETILAARPDVEGRLKIEPDGSVKVLKAGSTDMYIVPADGRTALDHLAEELAEKVEPKWKVSGGGRGSGTRGSEGGHGSTSTVERFEQTRARIKESEKKAAESKVAGSGLERLGGRRS